MGASLVVADRSDLRGIGLSPDPKAAWKLPLPEDPIAISSFGRRIAVATPATITVMDENREPTATRQFSHVGSLATDHRAIYVGADGCLFCLSENLEEYSRVNLGFGDDRPGPNKNVDDILIYNDVAYLLDDIMAPLYVFKADVSDSQNISITERGEMWGLNAHLSLQFANPGFDQWVVKEDYCHQGGSGENLNFLRLNGKMSDILPDDPPYLRPLPPEMKTRTIFTWNSMEGAKGYRIMDVLPFPPHWSVVVGPHNGPHLAKLNTRNEKPLFAYVTPLYDNWTGSIDDAFGSMDFSFKIRRYENQLYILPVAKRTEWGYRTAEHVPPRLVSFDIGKKRPRKTGEFDLSSAGVKEARDFLVLSAEDV